MATTQQDVCDVLLKTGMMPIPALQKLPQPQSVPGQQAIYNMGGLAELLDQRLVFSVELGGFSTEPYDAIQIKQSPQLRQIAPGAVSAVQVYLVPKQYSVRIKSVGIKHFSAQARQDLQVSLWIGTVQVFTTGLVLPVSSSSSSLVGIAKETRLFANAGMPYTSIAKAGGIGYPDNFAPKDMQSFAIAHENDVIAWKVWNQSDLYTHAVELEMYGWAFPAPGRTKEEALREMLE